MSIPTQKIKSNPRFTKHLLDAGIFNEAPVTIIDVGARGGFESQWNIYGNQGKRIGFEVDADECEKLNDKLADTNTKYYPIALHRKQGFQDFYVQPHLASSSFYKSDAEFLSRFPGWKDLIPRKIRKIKTIGLDAFLKKERIPSVDFIKLDVEGAELDIFKGAKKILGDSIIGISTEAVFHPWRKGMPTFSDLDLFLRKLGFVLFDLPIFHWTRKSLSPLMFTDGVLGPSDKGQVTWTQAIYFRDAVKELESPKLRKKWDPIKILKLASMMELYNLEDCAIELLMVADQKNLLRKYDVRHLIDLITPPLNGKNVTYSQYVAHIKKEGPPRYINGKRVTQSQWLKYKKK